MAKQKNDSAYIGPCVVYNHTRYQDCSEDMAKMFHTVEQALAWINGQRVDPQWILTNCTDWAS